MVGKLGLGSFFYDTNGDFGALSGGLRYCQVDQRTEAVGFADADLRMPGAGCLPSQRCKLLILNAETGLCFVSILWANHPHRKHLAPCRDPYGDL